MRFQGSKAISQSDFDNVENRSQGVLRHGGISQMSSRHRRAQVIRFVQV